MFYENKLLSYEQRFERYNICCDVCGDRMENLVWNPIQHQWRCVPCYEQAHKNFPKVYP